MVRKGLLLAVLMVMVSSVNAFAAGGWSVGVNGGVLKGTGDFGDATDTGFGGGVEVDYMINDMFCAGADFSFNKVKHKDDGEDAAVVYPGSGLTGTIKDEITIMNYGVHGKYMFPMGESKLKPYIVAGAGMYNLKEKFETSNFSEEPSDNKFGGRGGLGLNYMVNEQFGVGAEGNFHFISTEGTSTQMVTGVVMLTFMIPSGK